MELNESQRAVAEHKDGAIAVLAIAGAGKTQAIVERCVSLLQSGVLPSRILAVTFSKAGADEMNRRLAKRLGTTQMRIGTFHSVALQIITKHVYQGRAPDVRDGAFDIDVKKVVQAYKKQKEHVDYEVAVRYIARCKAEVATPDSVEARKLAESFTKEFGSRANAFNLVCVYQEVEQIRKDAGYITFDDMLYEAVLVLTQNEDVRKQWASRWDYVIQDEAQDQNAAQHMIADLLSRDHKNLMMVGDPSQAVYTFRGARAESLKDFTVQYDAKVVRMEHNYRSGRAILALGEKVLHTCGLDEQARMLATKDHDGAVRGFLFASEHAEASHVCAEIGSLISSGVAPHDIAILIRAGMQSLRFEVELRERKIPYHLSVGLPFYKRRDIATLLSYLRLGTKLDTLEDWEQTLRRPTKYLTLANISAILGAARLLPESATMQQIVAAAQKGQQGYAWEGAMKWARLIDGFTEQDILRRNAGEVLSHTIKMLDYYSFLEKEKEVGLLDEGLADAHRVLIGELLARARRVTVGELLADVTETLKYSALKPQAQGRVALTTVHRAKGLEWPHVYVAGVTAGVFPSRKAPFLDEARIFYVAVTRARDHLTVSGLRGFDPATQQTSTSEFLKLMPALNDVSEIAEGASSEIEGVRYFVER